MPIMEIEVLKNAEIGNQAADILQQAEPFSPSSRAEAFVVSELADVSK